MSVTREQSRAATMERIVSAARQLIDERKEVTLRAVAGVVKMTPPALYRYVDSHEELIRLVALDIDRDVADELRRIAGELPADDAAGRLVAAGTGFRAWALRRKAEFAMVFTNIDVDCVNTLKTEAATGLLFSELLAAVWMQRQFAIPAMDELDPDLAEILRDPLIPADLANFPDELRGLLWILQRAWVALYGTVTLEVYGHVDPRLVERRLLFKNMVVDQAARMDLTDEAPRLMALIDEVADREC